MMESPDPQSRGLILAAGMRVTRQRVAVLDAVAAEPHASASRVLAAVGAVLPGVSHQAVYDCLTHLTGAGLLRRFAVDGGAALYETRTRDNHHHFVCRDCALVVDIDCAVGTAPCIEAASGTEFVIDEAEVIYRGLCMKCVSARADPVTYFAHPDLPEETPNG